MGDYRIKAYNKIITRKIKDVLSRNVLEKWKKNEKSIGLALSDGRI